MFALINYINKVDGGVAVEGKAYGNGMYGQNLIFGRYLL